MVGELMTKLTQEGRTWLLTTPFSCSVCNKELPDDGVLVDKNCNKYCESCIEWLEV